MSSDCDEMGNVDENLSPKGIELASSNKKTF